MAAKAFSGEKGAASAKSNSGQPGVQRKLRSKNKEGQCLNILLREYRQGDEPGMVACIRDEYGDTYFRSEYYQTENLRRAAESGHIVFLVAEALSGAEGKSGAELQSDDEMTPGTDTLPGAQPQAGTTSPPGELAGMLTIRRFASPENTCELASQIFRKKYRGCGLAMPFLEYAMELVRAGGYASVFGLSALFHNTTQRLLSRLGLKPCGFAFGILDMDRIAYSYRKDRNPKHPGGIQVLALEKRDAGTLYLPPELAALCRQIYDRLGVSCRIDGEPGGEGGTESLGAAAGVQTSGPAEADRARFGTGFATLQNQEALSQKSSLTWKEDEGQSSLEIRIHRAGNDLGRYIEGLCRRYPLRGRQTANVYVNLCDTNAAGAYRELTRRGFVFAGFHPLCGEREYLVLHHPGETKICPRDYVLTEEWNRMLEAIRFRSGVDAAPCGLQYK